MRRAMLSVCWATLAALCACSRREVDTVTWRAGIAPQESDSERTEREQRERRDAERGRWGGDARFTDEELDTLAVRRAGDSRKPPGSRRWKELTEAQANYSQTAAFVFANGHISETEAWWLINKVFDIEHAVKDDSYLFDNKVDQLLVADSFIELPWGPAYLAKAEAHSLALVGVIDHDDKYFMDRLNAFLETKPGKPIEDFLREDDRGMPASATQQYKKAQATARASRIASAFVE